ncbi:hypothetical protein JTB14_010181 [Gonioctena quinquepunctata]|nr:hypothetical protein JTB14_010181 [Gonioctena quinquepunctata]
MFYDIRSSKVLKMEAHDAGVLSYALASATFKTKPGMLGIAPDIPTLPPRLLEEYLSPPRDQLLYKLEQMIINKTAVQLSHLMKICSTKQSQMEPYFTPLPLNLSSMAKYNQNVYDSPNTHILDLCTKKRSRADSPDYSFTYPSPKRSPPRMEPSSTSGSRSPNSMSECSENSNLSDVCISSTTKLKTRPFKAFPKDPSLRFANTEALLPIDSSTSYAEFREKMLAQVQSTQNIINKNMRRNQLSSKSEDPSYLEKRKKNNEAAKRSRDARKAKEDEIAIRCAFLEQDNMKLKFTLAALSNEVNRLESMVNR